MATAPFPFFYTPPYAYSSATAYPPTASGFSIAPVHPFPSAFPCAATYPYPPSAVAYTPTSGFSPNWPIWPSPPPAPSPIPTPIDPNRPPPTPPPLIHGDLHNASYPYAATYSYPHPASAYTPTPGSFPAPAYDTSAFSPAPPESIASAATHSSSTPACTYAPTTDFPPPPCDFGAPAFDPTNGSNTSNTSTVPEILSKASTGSNNNTITQLAHTRSSLDLLHGELSKLSALVSQYAVAMGMKTSEALVTGSSPVITPAQFSSPATTALMFSGTGVAASSLASSLSSPSDASATAVVVPQMFGEMPQSYGFNNLLTQSVFLADGTKRHYYTLPENYPLELATHEPVFNVDDEEKDGCSNGFVHVFSSTPEQQTYEEEQQVSDQLVKCVSKATDRKQTSACLNTALDVQVFSLELQKQDDERAYSCSDLKASGLVVTRSSQLSIEHRMLELRLLWDPGASASLHASKLRVLQWNVLVSLERRKEWDPGDTKLHVLFMTAAGATKLQCIDIDKSEMLQALVWSPIPFSDGLQYHLPMNNTPSVWDPGILNQMDMMLDNSAVPNQAHSGQTQFKLSILVGQRADLKQFLAQLLLPSQSWYNTTNAFLHVHYCCLPFVLDCPYSEPVQLLVCYSRMFSLTEAILSAMRMSTATTVRMILVLSSGEIAQEARDAAAVYHVFKTQLAQLSLYCWLDIWTKWRETVKLLSCTNIPELATWQSQVTIASYVWDPGTMLLWYRSIWSLMFTKEKEMRRLIPEKWSLRFNAMLHCQTFQKCKAVSSHLYWHQDIMFNGIDLWMIHFISP